MPDWAVNLIGVLLSSTVIGTATGALLAFRKDKRDARLAPVQEQQAEASLTEQLQRLAQHAVDQVRADMERAEEEHARQLTILRTQLRRMDDAHRLDSEQWERQRQGLKDHINVLSEALREHAIPVPDYAERTA